MVRYTQSSVCIAQFTLAVDRRVRKDEEKVADFISCKAFGKAGEQAEKYFHKGLKIALTGRIETGNYTNKDGKKVYTTDVVLEQWEFAESKKESDRQNEGYQNTAYQGRQGQSQPQNQQRQDYYQQQSFDGYNSYSDMSDGGYNGYPYE